MPDDNSLPLVTVEASRDQPSCYELPTINVVAAPNANQGGTVNGNGPGSKLKDISSLLCFAKVTQPDLPIPDLGDISIIDLSQMDGMGGIALGRVGPYPWSGVELSSRFISPLRPLPGNTLRSTRYELFDTIIHETIHTTQNFLYRAFFAGGAEQSAWKEARHRSAPYAEDLRRGVAYAGRLRPSVWRESVLEQ